MNIRDCWLVLVLGTACTLNVNAGNTDGGISGTSATASSASGSAASTGTTRSGSSGGGSGSSTNGGTTGTAACCIQIGGNPNCNNVCCVCCPGLIETDGQCEPSSSSSIGSGPTSSSGSSGGGTGSGGNAVSGQQGFGVQYAVMSIQEPADDCGFYPLENGEPTAISVVLAQQDLSGPVCGSGPPPSAPTALVDVQVTGPQGGQPLAPGTYTIGNEDIADDDLCSLPSGTQAILDVRLYVPDGGATNVWSAISGSVTLAAVGDAGASGSFDVVLGQVDNGSDTIDSSVTSPLSGTFAAPACAPIGDVTDNGLLGAGAFRVSYSVLLPGDVGACPQTSPLDGVKVILASSNLTALACSGSTQEPDSGYLIVMQLASPQYVTYEEPFGPTGNYCDGGIPGPLTPGVLNVGFEGVSDDDLGMLPLGAQATLDLKQFGFNVGNNENLAQAVSGTIQITTVSSFAIAGDFDVMLAFTDGGFDPQADGGLSELSGPFFATSCGL